MESSLDPSSKPLAPPDDEDDDGPPPLPEDMVEVHQKDFSPSPETTTIPQVYTNAQSSNHDEADIANLEQVSEPTEEKGKVDVASEQAVASNDAPGSASDSPVANDQDNREEKPSQDAETDTDGIIVDWKLAVKTAKAFKESRQPRVPNKDHVTGTWFFNSN